MKNGLISKAESYFISKNREPTVRCSEFILPNVNANKYLNDDLA